MNNFIEYTLIQLENRIYKAESQNFLDLDLAKPES